MAANKATAPLWVSLCVVVTLTLLLAACAPATPPVKRIVLLAPFEGAYREIGYDMLYPMRLALADAAVTDITLLSLDDGGSVDTAAAHATALADDPTVLAALVAGAFSADSRVLAAFGDVPVIVIGDWNAAPRETAFVLAAADTQTRLTSTETDVYAAAVLDDVTGGETFGLKAFAATAEHLDSITVMTSARSPSDEFTQRLIDSDLFVPAPGLLATLAYDAGTFVAQAVTAGATRADVRDWLRGNQIDGLNGVLRFGADGYWADAPLYDYRYVDGVLTAND